MSELNFKGKKLVKIVSTMIVVCVIAAALIGVGLLFKIIQSSNTIGNIMLTFLTLFIAGLFLLNSIKAVTVGNKVGNVAAVMLMISAALFVVLIWFGGQLGDFGDAYGKITVIVAMISIMLDLIIGNYIILGKSLLFVQILQYVSFAYVELVVALAILGDPTLVAYWQVLVLACIIALTLYIVLKVKEKNIAQEQVDHRPDGDEYVTITKTEYENLKAEIARLRELTADSQAPAVPVETEKE